MGTVEHSLFALDFIEAIIRNFPVLFNPAPNLSNLSARLRLLLCLLDFAPEALSFSIPSFFVFPLSASKNRLSIRLMLISPPLQSKGRMSPMMANYQDPDLIASQPEKKIVGKSLQISPPQIPLDNAKPLGMLGDLSD